jgi:hypothetical protein
LRVEENYKNKYKTLNFLLLTLVIAHVAQLAEHILGKDEVTGSIPVMGSERRIRRQIWQRLNLRG